MNAKTAVINLREMEINHEGYKVMAPQWKLDIADFIEQQEKRIDELNDLGFKFTSNKTIECKHCGWAFTQYGKEEICHICERKFAELGRMALHGFSQELSVWHCRGNYDSDLCKWYSNGHGCERKDFCQKRAELLAKGGTVC